MKISRKIKVNNKTFNSQKIDGEYQSDTELLKLEEPLIVNGILAFKKTLNLIKEFQNVLWIQPNILFVSRIQTSTTEYQNITLLDTIELSRQLITDFFLKDYSAVVVSNMHEKTVYREFSFFKIIIQSKMHERI